MAPLQQNLQTKLSWSATDYGLFTSGYGWFNVFLLMLVFSGMILDKMGTRFTGVLATIVMILGAGIKYWAVSGNVGGMYELTIGGFELIGKTPKSAVMAGLGFAIFGVGSEMFGIAANKAVVRWFRGKEMALAIGLNTSTGRIGTALAMFTPLPLYNLTKDVSAPVLLSIVLLFIGLLVFLLFNMMDKRLDREESDAGIAEDEEFKGTGNCEIHLDRRMAEKRVYPSILINKSGTRREELLLKPEILQKSWILRKLLYPMDEIEAMEFVLDKMKSTKNNHDFFDMMRRGG
jgi:MFS family permease